MQIPRPIQPMIGHKDGFDDLPVLSECDDDEIAHIQVDTDRHENRISSALDDLFRFDCFRLRKMQFDTLLVENQLGAFFFPGGFLYPLLARSARSGPGSCATPSATRCRLSAVQNGRLLDVGLIEDWKRAHGATQTPGREAKPKAYPTVRIFNQDHIDGLLSHQAEQLLHAPAPLVEAGGLLRTIDFCQASRINGKPGELCLSVGLRLRKV